MENAPESRRENPPSCLYQEGNKQRPGWLSDSGDGDGKEGRQQGDLGGNMQGWGHWGH